jgi:TonB family protein
VKDIPAFYRSVIRVEMRCSLSGAESPSILTPVTDRFKEWMTTQLGPLNLGDTDSKRAEALRALLSQKALDDKPMVRAAALSFLAEREPDNDSYASQALTALTEARAPIEMVNFLRISRIAEQSKPPRKWQSTLRDMAAEPSFVNDPLSSSTALLQAADSYRGSRLPDAPAMLQKVANDTRLPVHHPLRQAARLSLANLAAEAGDLPAAQRYFADTALTEQQCALIGVTPSLRKTGAESGDYPMEAVRMGFEGWVRLEFNVTADGRTAQARPIVAYPPLIFVEAALDMTKSFRYEASYRPEGGAACNANHTTVSFINP